jgi:hypothetical protein
MAITLLTQPTTGAPITSADYTSQNDLISANQVPNLSILTGWETVGAAPAIKQGSYIRHAGNTYEVDTADEAISGTPSAGVNYIALTLSGSTITAAWVTSITGYSYNPAYGGIYNGTGLQLIRDVVRLDTGNYIRGMGFGQDFNYIYYADGQFYAGSDYNITGDIIAGGGVTSGGEIETTSGGVTATGDGIFGGKVQPGAGVSATVSIHGTYSRGSIWTFLKDYVTVNNPDVICCGAIGAGTSVYTASRAHYVSSTRIDIYCIIPNGNLTVQSNVQGDSATAYTYSLTI